MTTLPPHLKQAAEIECLGKCSDCCLEGVQWLYSHLLKAAPEFDDKAAMGWFKSVNVPFDDFDEMIISIARWQHQQSAAQIAALQAEVQRLEEDNESLTERHRLTAEIIEDAKNLSPENGKALLYNMDKLKQENERLRLQVQRLEEEVQELKDENFNLVCEIREMDEG